MLTVGQIYYRVLDTGTGTYVSSGQNIYEDIVPQYGGATRFTKLGIQAPAGTRLVINKNKNIIIGRTGIYELDDEIDITNLYFLRPRKYVRDEEASNRSMDAGMKAMQDAEKVRAEALRVLNQAFPSGPPQDTSDPNYDSYWSQYESIQTTYHTSYEAGLIQYEIGKAGIYILPNPNNVEAEENYEDLYNIIVDFIYE